jgi:hypothetical protein
MTLRRLKTYTAQTGYVYQCYFVGQRDALPSDPESPATEYIFDVTSDRKTTFAVSVFLQEETVRTWAALHGRGLNEAEQYGAVKMRLFQAFDEIEDMIAAGRHLLVSKGSLESSTEKLGVD